MGELRPAACVVSRGVLKLRILVVFCPKGLSLLVHEEQTHMCGLYKFATVFMLTIISLCG